MAITASIGLKTTWL